MGLPNTRHLRLLPLALAICAAFVGCFAQNTAGGGGGLHFAESANYVKPLSTRAEVEPGSSYVYGSLLLHARTGGPRFSLGLENAHTGEVRRILFNTSFRVMAVPLPPGTYRITHTLMAGRSRYIEGEYAMVPFEEPLFSKPFKVGAGSLVYIGDYVAETEMAGGTGLGFRYAGRLASVGYNFEETTAALKQKYAKLAAREASSAWAEADVQAWLASVEQRAAGDQGSR